MTEEVKRPPFKVSGNATKSTERTQHIQAILKHNRAVTVWLRVGFDLRVISTKLWSLSVEMLNSVGKQASGWLNKTHEKAPAV